MTDNVIDIITRNVTDEIATRFEGLVAQLNAEALAAKDRADALFDQLEADGQRRMDELFSKIPVAAVITEDGDFDPVGWIKAQATSRALRTLIQGLLAVAVMAVGNVVVQALTQGTLNVFSWDDWKVVGTLAGSAALASGIAYVQNKFGIKPPKVT
ncbi:hypothetical protein CH249_14020 [Rhodococcus sp. 05-2255-3B1]|uniref:hypothetical protein n=1 Tax=unclassified Rhodococcus (in: high G+C Gram-positive bacteria) TaxID=192944 RepID=UPI000B9C0784|nr:MULTISPECIES: hypothetical protein [unclassified Rhodococcus (in: high G+C Gram-positive bacteria)]OZE08453.1 hypothetical protein CH250_17315 [Rhodococcus sp. 05-2255-3C]OZE10198.1 hypothetical protein CH249_14020 [Rhodococcus sp. 05-2255-3B1]OZE25076.1 hypothetical protein CH255_00485 [Rhodococcus sp. 05-2255-2A2]OZE90207.1 hypothetical protein CH302_27535 [Rhodococcus sp. 15-2388-1-1a]